MKNQHLHKIYWILGISILIDLWIKFHMQSHEGITQSYFQNILHTGKVETFKMSFLFSNDLQTNILFGFTTTLKIGCIMLFFELQKSNLGYLLRISLALLIAGWLGNDLDCLIFSEGRNRYVYMGYIIISLPFNHHELHPLLKIANGHIRSISSISTFFIQTGAIFFIVAFIAEFKYVKQVFQKRDFGFIR